MHGRACLECWEVAFILNFAQPFLVPLVIALLIRILIDPIIDYQIDYLQVHRLVADFVSLCLIIFLYWDRNMSYTNINNVVKNFGENRKSTKYHKNHLKYEKYWNLP